MMGISRRDALDDIESLTPRIHEHREKLRANPLADAYNHWLGELRGWIRIVQRRSRHVGKKTQAEVLKDVSQWKQAAGIEDDKGAGTED
jgi:hypothetical protein